MQLILQLLLFCTSACEITALIGALAIFMGSASQANSDLQHSSVSHPPSHMAGVATTTVPLTIDSQPSADLTYLELLMFQRGKLLFRRHWDDLLRTGQLSTRNSHNADSCDHCHINGFGSSPDRDTNLVSPVVDLVAFRDVSDGDRRTIPDIQGSYDHTARKLQVFWIHDPNAMKLIRPIAIDKQHEKTYSVRMAPAIMGLGLIEKITDEQILSWYNEVKMGRPRVPNKNTPITNKFRIGKFGWKASTSSVNEILVEAMLNELGVQKKYLSDAELQDLEFYSKEIALTARTAEDTLSKRGFQIFSDIGCAVCHRPSYIINRKRTKASYQLRIWPFSDFLLHDLGRGLKGNKEGDVAETEWKTPPLWGMASRKIAKREMYLLHDGRARSIEEAILWHSGEAEQSKHRFLSLPNSDIEILVHFVESL